MIEVRTFRLDDQAQLGGMEPAGRMFEAQRQICGPAYTIEADGVPIAACGIQLFWDGVGEAWAILSTEFGRQPRGLDTMRAVVDWMIVKHNLRRVHAHMLASWEPGIRFVRRFGFHQEHEKPLLGYFPGGEDCLVFARYS